MRRLLQLVVPCLTLLSGCYGTEKGVEVPQDEIYFPVGLALDPRVDEAGKSPFLYVVSSDFDLQYNGGAVQSYDLDKLWGVLPKPCDDGEDGIEGLCRGDDAKKVCVNEEQDGGERLLYPGACKPLTPHDYQTSSVKIGAFATDAIIRRQSDRFQTNGEKLDETPRLFVPVRGDSTLHFIDIDRDTGGAPQGLLQCGQANNDGACDDAHRAGDDPDQNTRGLTLNAEPFSADADPSGETLVITNQTSGTASLFVTDDWSRGPTLQFELTIDTRLAPIGVAYVPFAQSEEPTRTDLTGETFMMTFRNSAQIRLLRFNSDGESVPKRPFLADGNSVGIDANSVGSDSRGLAVDDSARKAAEAGCQGDEACLKSAALVPLDVYVANRSPASLLIGRTQPPQQYPFFYDTLPLTQGPSRVVVGKVKALDGSLETRVFVVCFDSRRVFVYDPKRARIETEIFTARGPHAVAVDTERRLLYVGHFTDSYIGVYSLDLEHPDTYGTLLGSLGTPKAPRSSK